ncbi:MAG TPA: DICT sensory domain-containing protein [Ktedonobacterales bacterium]|nr:DICT sensory domain-containing protein [Ktedonobacterales bacterium]
MTSSDNTRNMPDQPGRPMPDAHAEREAFTQNLLRWQSDSPSYGASAAPSSGSATASTPPAQALSEIIQRASARSVMWDGQRLSDAAQSLRANGQPIPPDAAFYTNISIMNVISHAIEERIIAERRRCEVYAGFQRLALVRPQLRRYRALAEFARHVYLFGIDDTKGDAEVYGLGPQTTLRFDIKPALGTGLEHFWFVVVDDSRTPTALLAQHTEGDLWSPRQANRSFAGIWTFDPGLVAEIIAILRRGARILYYNTPAAGSAGG